jgi:hypothetical protein
MSSASRSLAGSVGRDVVPAADALRCGRKAACMQDMSSGKTGSQPSHYLQHLLCI